MKRSAVSYSKDHSRIFLLLFIFIIIIVFHWLDKVPFFLSIDSEFKRSVSISLSVVSYSCMPPELLESKCYKYNVGVVSFMVVANPGSNHSPHGFPGWVRSKSRNFLWSSTYTYNLVSHILVYTYPKLVYSKDFLEPTWQ